MLDNQIDTSFDYKDKPILIPQEIVEERKKKRNSRDFKGDSRKDFEKLNKMDQEILKRLENAEDIEDNG